VWLGAALLLLLAAGTVYLAPRLWWAPALAGVALSQILIVGVWSDAAFGTVANAVLLVPILLAAVDLRPSSLRSIYLREAKESLAKDVLRRGPGIGGPVTRDDLAELPASVRTYLERAGAVGSPRVRSLRAGFRARIRGGPDESWMEGSAEQHELFHPPVRLFFMVARKAGLPVHVLHRYADGEATMEGRLLGLFRIFRISGSKLTRSETVTLLNDIFFLAPAVLADLPVEWEELGRTQVRATYTNAGHTVSAVLRFHGTGDLADFESEDRYQMDRDPPVLARWSTPFYPHREYESARLPSGGEACWGEAGKAWSYADFQLRWIRYNVSAGS
jgi:hypothetical protein